MIVVGASWILFWLLADIFKLELTIAALVTGVVCVLLALLTGESPRPHRT